MSSATGNSTQQQVANPEVVEFIRAVRERVATVVVGQDVVVERLLIALFTGGHLLLQGVPGLAKTLLVSVLSKTIDLEFDGFSLRSTCCPPTFSVRKSLIRRRTSSAYTKARSSPTCFSLTRLTALPRKFRVRCSKRCRNAKSRSAVKHLNSRLRSW